LNSIALQRADNPIPGANLNDMHILPRFQPEVLGCDTRAGMKRSSESADADALAAELLRIFDLRANHKIQHQCANHGRDDLHIGPAHCGSRCRAAGNLNE